MKEKLILLTFALALSACAHTPPQTTLTTPVNTVRVAAQSTGQHLKSAKAAASKAVEKSPELQPVLDDINEAEKQNVVVQNELVRITDAAAKIQEESDAAQAATVKAEAATVKAQVATTKAKMEAHENAKERDVVLFTFAGICALWALWSAKAVIPSEPMQYAIIANVVVFALAFGASYGFGRVALFQLAKFIP